MGFVTGILSGTGRAGLSPAQLLEHAGIATDLAHDLNARIPVARYAALYRLINDSLDDEGFALFSRPLRRGSFEFLCRAVLSAPTLGLALERIARYLHVALDDLAVEIEKSGRAAVIVISEEQALPVGPAGRVFAYEWLLRMIHGLAAWLVAHPLPLDEVSFPYPPPLHAADYELVFAPRYTFDAPRLEARFPAEWLTLPVRRDEAALRVFLADAPARPRIFLVHFEAGTNVLTPASQEQLAGIRAALATLPAGEAIVIGHTDRLGSIEANDRLSLQRAEVARSLLVSAGVAPEAITVVGRGEREPVVRTDDEVAEARNRRVEIKLR